jgi:hypothetical protein
LEFLGHRVCDGRTHGVRIPPSFRSPVRTLRFHLASFVTQVPCQPWIASKRQ